MYISYKYKMTEKDKMINEFEYLSMDNELVELRNKACQVINEFNNTVCDEKDLRNRHLSSLINAKGNFFIKPPFHCDYGFNIYVGDNFYCNYDCIMLDVCNIKIGDNVMIGPNVQLYTAEHPLDYKLRNTGIEMGREITIGNNVWIGGGTIICPGVSIGDNTVIGAGSLVTKSIPSDVLAFGHPCIVIREINEK